LSITTFPIAEGYYRRPGVPDETAGRDECIAFYSFKDIQKLEKFKQGKPLPSRRSASICS
jgi:hypothetical protein